MIQPGQVALFPFPQTDQKGSNLKSESLVRVSRLAVVDAHPLAGAIGKVSDERLKRIRGRIAEWIGRSS